MLKLTDSASSPFVRKVRLAIAIKGLSGSVQNVTAEGDPALNKEIRSRNPLRKIPSLMLDDGRVIYDSHVICEFLDTLTPEPRLFPAEASARIDTLTLAALADGIIEASLLVVLEKRMRPEAKWVQDWIDRQQAKVDAGLAALEAAPPRMGKSPTYGDLTLASALGYLDFRQQGAWRKNHPKLVAWLDGFAAAVPAYAETMPPKE